MKKAFNILDSSLNIHRNYLLEASAGTGKTFSIQNLVVRLIAESMKDGSKLSLDEILVVTFTRAATRELKSRIRSNLLEALAILDGQEDIITPDYLKNYLEQGEHASNLAKKRIQQALFMFDQAQIFTIHSFCARMLQQFILESNTSPQSLLGEHRPLPQSELMMVVRDFFRTEIRQNIFSPAQITRYLKKDPEQVKLLKIVQSGYQLSPGPTFEEACSTFKKIMDELKKNHALCSDKMIDDFRKQSLAYSNYSKETKEVTFEKVCRFARLFDQAEWSNEDFDLLINDGLVWSKALNPKLLKKEAPKEVYFPFLTTALSASLEPLVEEAGNVSIILIRLAHACRNHLIRYQKEEEQFSPDDVLKKMNDSIKEPHFLKKVRNRYRAVIVDEFQDTDPLQWEIFSSLFLPSDQSWNGNIYLVGDPKQSIYSFRQADIYTYLSAAKSIGEENCLSLDVNYRSQANLIEALNVLFSNENLPSFIPLPKISSDLCYHPVQPFKPGKQLDSLRGALHFFIANCQNDSKPTLHKLELNVYFPFISSEISRLRAEKEISLQEFVILVRDRHQASRLIEHFKKENIPFSNQRGASIAQSSALVDFILLIQALLHPRNRGKILAAFSTPIFGWDEEELKNSESIDFLYLTIQKLRLSLKEKGFSHFFYDLLQVPCKPGGPSVIEQLLSRKNGREIYRDLQQLADLISDNQYVEWNSMEGIIPFLDQIHLWEENDDERVKRYEDPDQEGVKIMTLHMSKGLEFSVVFALGLINRDEIREELIPVESEGKIHLVPFKEESKEYRQYCEERDSEKMRQLYVALTRAKNQLYIPVALHFPSEKLSWGEASPIDLFLGRFYQSTATYELLYERIQQGLGPHLIDFIETKGKDHFMTYSIHQKFEGNTYQMPIQDFPILHTPPHVTVLGKPIWMTSFTSLSQHNESLSDSPLNFPTDFQCPLKNNQTLPAGSETGVIIHRILEKLTFSDFEGLTQADQAIPFIRPHLQFTPFNEWEETIADMIFKTLKTPLIHPTFTLSSIKENALYREMPFLFPYQDDDKIENIDFKEGLIKGVIDLLFYHEGLYYLVDWKTNWLSQYDPDSLHTAMLENNYFLQAAIYTQATQRFLKLVDPRPFEECFGGIYYLFLRGMENGRSTGIYECKINSNLLN